MPVLDTADCWEFEFQYLPLAMPHIFKKKKKKGKSPPFCRRFSAAFTVIA